MLHLPWRFLYSRPLPHSTGCSSSLFRIIRRLCPRPSPSRSCRACASSSVVQSRRSRSARSCERPSLPTPDSAAIPCYEVRAMPSSAARNSRAPSGPVSRTVSDSSSGRNSIVNARKGQQRRSLSTNRGASGNRSAGNEKATPSGSPRRSSTDPKGRSVFLPLLRGYAVRVAGQRRSAHATLPVGSPPGAAAPDARRSMSPPYVAP